jgi:hypothetical protein
MCPRAFIDRSGKRDMNQLQINDQLSKAHAELAKWQAPEDFIEKVEAADQLLESAVLFNKASINFLFDALVIAEFVKLRPPEKVRLADPREQWPDGFTGIPKAFNNIEVTEVMEPGRRRGDEYRPANMDKEPKPDRPEDWRARGAQIPRALEAAIKKKIGKNYGVKPVLLIELNINDYGLLQKETVEAIARLKAQYVDSFQDICVIWKGALY